MHCIINGGGLVGAFAAITMLKHFDKVTVIEKRGDLRLEGVEGGRSINLVLTSRGLYALREYGLEEKAMAITVPVEGRIMHPISGAKDIFQPYGVCKEEVNYSVSRTGLNQLLIEEAEKRGVQFLFEHSLVSAKLPTVEGESVVAVYTNLKDGKDVTIEADVLFGTDGVASASRKILLQHLRDTTAPDAADRIEKLGISYKELTFPPSANNEYSMNSKGLHIWPRGAHFLMALADLTNSFTGTLYLPDGFASLDHIPGIDSVSTFDDLAKSPEKLKEYIRANYPDVEELVPDYVEQLTSRGHSYLATVRSSHWHSGSSALVFGDAAHGIVPFFGQGMNLGLESATILDKMLTIKNGGADKKVQQLSHKALGEVFAAFEEYHHPSSDAIADMAIENFTEMAYKVGLPEFLQRKAMERAAESAAPKAFRSRYYMVTKTLIPYKIVKEAGDKIDDVVTSLLATYAAKGVTSDFDGKVTKEDVEAAAAKELAPYLAKYGIAVGEPLRDYYPRA